MRSNIVTIEEVVGLVDPTKEEATKNFIKFY
jgi:hypothetical protein